MTPVEHFLLHIFKNNKIKTDDIYNAQYIDEINKYIQQMEDILIKYNISFNRIIILNNIPLISAITHLMHPNFIKYMKDTYYKDNFVKIKMCNIYDNMPNLYNKQTKILNVKETIKQLLEELYPILYHNLQSASFKNKKASEIKLKLLDEYAKIFDINYEKITYE